jgi:hypothetical protein
MMKVRNQPKLRRVDLRCETLLSIVKKMTLTLVTINVNGMRDNKKRDLVFNWLVAKKN